MVKPIYYNNKVFLKYPTVNFDYDKVMLTLNNLVIPNYDDDGYFNIYDCGFGCDGEDTYQHIYGKYNDVFISIEFDTPEEKREYRQIQINTTDENIINKIVEAFSWFF